MSQGDKAMKQPETIASSWCVSVQADGSIVGD
jgi:hypothetical protein